MPGDPIQQYLEGLDEPQRTTLAAVCDSIVELLPDAEPCLAYGAPAFKVRGKAVAGLAAARDHLSYLPHSGTVLTELGDEVAGYATSKGALRFASDTPLPRTLLEKLVAARLRELGMR
jgi:uncharacterized protein YdhG (YjbR/CyaY superfamily)